MLSAVECQSNGPGGSVNLPGMQIPGGIRLSNVLPGANITCAVENRQSGVSISKGGPSEPVEAGSSIQFPIVVTNSGATDMTDIRVVDSLPIGLTFGSASGSGWSCEASGQVVTCDQSATLGAGASTPELVVTATVDSGTGEALDLRNVAFVTSSSGQATDDHTVTKASTTTTTTPTEPTTTR